MTAPQVLVKLLQFDSGVEEPTAVELGLQVFLGLIFHDSPRRVQKCLLENVNMTNKSQRH